MIPKPKLYNELSSQRSHCHLCALYHISSFALYETIFICLSIVSFWKYIYVCIFIFLLSYTKGNISYTPSFTLLFCVTLYHGDHTITTGKDHLHSFLELHSILLYKYTLGLFNQFATDGYFGFKYFCYKNWYHK